AAVHRLRVFDALVGPLACRRIGRREEDVHAAGRRVRIPRAGIAVVVRDDVVAAVAVQIHDGDLVPAGDFIEDDPAVPLATLACRLRASRFGAQGRLALRTFGVDDDLVAVPRLDGRKEPFAILLADADVARAKARRLLQVPARQQRLLDLHAVAAAPR